MYDSDSGGFGPRPMYTPKDGVVWTCSCTGCGRDHGSPCNEEIKELPFQPRTDANGLPASPLYCRECHRARMQSSGPRQRY